MTAKDYRLIADVLATRVEREAGNTTKRAEIRREAYAEVAYALAAALRADNPRFDDERFLSAAGIETKRDTREREALMDASEGFGYWPGEDARPRRRRAR